jgi:hypothetical protein
MLVCFLAFATTISYAQQSEKLKGLKQVEIVGEDLRQGEKTWDSLLRN